ALDDRLDAHVQLVLALLRGPGRGLLPRRCRLRSHRHSSSGIFTQRSPSQRYRQLLMLSLSTVPTGMSLFGSAGSASTTRGPFVFSWVFFSFIRQVQAIWDALSRSCAWRASSSAR